jgi:hypothetical protein
MRWISVVIPTWNGRQYLAPCLDALRAQLRPADEVIVGDGGSTDGTGEFLQREYPEVTVVALPENRGFAGTTNAGIRRARGEYIATLNNDTQVHPGWLRALEEALETHPGVGHCGSKMLRADDPSIVDSAGTVYRWDGWAQMIGTGERDDGRFDQQVEVFGACAGAALYRRTLFDEIGLFDEDFFANYEDLDLDFRAQLRGYRCLFVPTARVLHVAGPTRRRLGRRAVFLGFLNNLRVIAKDLPASVIRRHLGAILRGHAAAVRYAFSEGQGATALAAYLAAAKEWRALMRKRKAIQAAKRVSDEYIESWLVHPGETPAGRLET